MTSPSVDCVVRAVSCALPLIVWIFLLHGCAEAPPREEPVAAESRAPDYTKGARIYQANCAACHDTGQRDAPTLDDIEAWDGRAFQWDALLRQHAAQGFLSMPPEGGHPELSETNVSDALFFMETKIRALDE